MRFLDVLGDVDIETPAGRATLTGRGSRIVVHVPTIRVLRSLTKIPGAKLRTFRQVRTGIRRTGLTLDVRLGGHSVATFVPVGLPRLRPWILLRACLA